MIHDEIKSNMHASIQNGLSVLNKFKMTFWSRLIAGAFLVMLSYLYLTSTNNYIVMLPKLDNRLLGKS